MINCFDTELFQEFIYFPGPGRSGIIKEHGGMVFLKAEFMSIIDTGNIRNT